MTQRKIFTLGNSKVVDQVEWDYPNPVIVIWNAVKRNSTESTLSLDGDLEQYAEGKEEVHTTMTYSANFWGKASQHAAGLGTRPLGYFDIVQKDVIDENGDKVTEGVKVWTTSFEADLKHPDSVQVMNGPMPENDKRLRVIELDIIRRFT